jgi:RNA polymerase II-associated factor 1
VNHVLMSQEELDERDDMLAEVTDPMFMRGGESDADGEAEPDESGVGFSSAAGDGYALSGT